MNGQRRRLAIQHGVAFLLLALVLAGLTAPPGAPREQTADARISS